MSEKFELELKAFVTEEQFRKAKKLCQIKGMSMSGLIRSLIAQEICHSEYLLCSYENHKSSTKSGDIQANVEGM